MKSKYAALLSLLAFVSLSAMAQPAVKIAAGQYHTLFIRNDSSLWAMGYNSSGQLGDSNTNNPNFYVNRPELIVSSGVTQIAAGQNFSLFRQSDGTLWAMGGDEYGQLGDRQNNYAGTNTPEQITNNVVTVAAGEYHSLFIKTDGSLWAMGFNEYGQLGDGTYGVSPYYATNKPELIVSNSVIAIAAGGNHSLFIKSDGSLWAMGYNYYGELGNGTNVNTNRAQLIVSNGVMAIAAGLDHSLFIKTNGSLWAMGRNDSGQLGTTNFASTNQPVLILSNGVTAISAGGNHSMFTKSDGSLWSMGENNYGELGIGIFSTNSPYGTNVPQLVTNSSIVAIAAGGYHSAFLKANGSLWTMGYNAYGELGDGTTGKSPNYSTNVPEQIITGSSTYNKVTAQLLPGGNVQISYVGVAGLSYALDRSFTVQPVNWVPQSTNTANPDGTLVMTNTPNPATNNYWRIRSVP